jgi:hypothetical protein
MSELADKRLLEASDADTHEHGVRAALIQVRRKRRDWILKCSGRSAAMPTGNMRTREALCPPCTSVGRQRPGSRISTTEGRRC